MESKYIGMATWKRTNDRLPKSYPIIREDSNSFYVEYLKEEYKYPKYLVRRGDVTLKYTKRNYEIYY